MIDDVETTVSKIPVSRKLARAEERLRALRERVADLAAQSGTILSVGDPASTADMSPRDRRSVREMLADVAGERSQAESELVHVRTEVAELRRSHAAAVRRALQPLRLAAERGLKSAFADVLAHLSELAEIQSAEKKAGCRSGVPIVRPRDLDLLVGKLIDRACGEAAPEAQHSNGAEPLMVASK